MRPHPAFTTSLNPSMRVDRITPPPTHTHTKPCLPTQHCDPSHPTTSAGTSREQHPNHHTKTPGTGTHTKEQCWISGEGRQISRSRTREKWTLGYEQSTHQMNSRCTPNTRTKARELCGTASARHSWSDHRGGRTPTDFSVTVALF